MISRSLNLKLLALLALACAPSRAAITMRVPGVRMHLPGVSAGPVRIISPVPSVSLKLAPGTTPDELRNAFMALTARQASIASNIEGFADRVHPMLAAGHELYAIGTPKGVAVLAQDRSQPTLLYVSPADLDPRFKAKKLPKKLENSLRAALKKDDVLKAQNRLSAYFDNLRK
jgi:hypothetical protein